MNYLELYLLNRANKLKDNIGTPSVGGAIFPQNEAAVDTVNSEGAFVAPPQIMTMVCRQTSHNHNWTSNPQVDSTWYSDSQNESSMNRAFWFALGDMAPQSAADSGTHVHKAGWQGNHDVGKTWINYLKQNWVGHAAHFHKYNGSTTYTSMLISVMFIKNTTASDVTRTVNWVHTTGANTSYSAGSAILFVPNSTAKTTTTDAVPTRLALQTSTNSYGYATQYSMTLPANKTVAMVNIAPANQWTTFTSGSHSQAANYIFNADTIFGDGIVPDYEMTTIAYQGRNNSFTSQSPHLIWTECGAIYGDD